MTSEKIGIVRFESQRVYALKPGTSTIDFDNPTAVVPPGEYSLMHDSETEEYWYAMTGHLNARGVVQISDSGSTAVVEHGDRPASDEQIAVESVRFSFEDFRSFLQDSNHKNVLLGGGNYRVEYKLWDGTVVIGMDRDVALRAEYGLSARERVMSPLDLLEKRLYERFEDHGDHVNSTVMDSIVEVLEELRWREPTRSGKPYRVRSVTYSDEYGSSGTSIVELEVPSADVRSEWLIGDGEWTIARRAIGDGGNDGTSRSKSDERPWWRRFYDANVRIAAREETAGDSE